MIGQARLLEILSDALPSCGVFEAEVYPDDVVLDCVVAMTAAEWRELYVDSEV